MMFLATLVFTNFHYKDHASIWQVHQHSKPVASSAYPRWLQDDGVSLSCLGIKVDIVLAVLIKHVSKSCCQLAHLFQQPCLTVCCDWVAGALS